MKNDEKKQIMQEFKHGNVDILVSTTVIEVGVNVPNATIMIIMDADRFGLSQLHQLRGRVGRGVKQSYAILVADPKTESGKERMATMTETTDGFVLAEVDLKCGVQVKFSEHDNRAYRNFKLLILLRIILF